MYKNIIPTQVNYQRSKGTRTPHPRPNSSGERRGSRVGKRTSPPAKIIEAEVAAVMDGVGNSHPNSEMRAISTGGRNGSLDPPKRRETGSSSMLGTLSASCLPHRVGSLERLYTLRVGRFIWRYSRLSGVGDAVFCPLEGHRASKPRHP